MPYLIFEFILHELFLLIKLHLHLFSNLIFRLIPLLKLRQQLLTQILIPLILILQIFFVYHHLLYLPLFRAHLHLMLRLHLFDLILQLLLSDLALGTTFLLLFEFFNFKISFVKLFCKIVDYVCLLDDEGLPEFGVML